MSDSRGEDQPTRSPAVGGRDGLDWKQVLPTRADQVPWAAIGVALVGIWVPFKILRVAHQDQSVALAIAADSDKASMVGGMLVSIAGIALPVALVTLVMFLERTCGSFVRTDEPDERAGYFKAMAAAAAAIGVLAWLMAVAAPWTSVAIVLLLSAAGHWLRGVTRRFPLGDGAPTRLAAWMSRHPRRRRLAASLTFVVAGTAFIASAGMISTVVNDQVWSPPTELSLTSGRVIVGYVLQRGDGNLVVLTERDRSIQVIRADAVRREHICRLQTATDNRSLADLIADRQSKGVPRCSA